MFGLYFWLFLFGFNYILSYLACLFWLLFFCCHRLVLVTTFQNMRSSMLSFGNHVGNEIINYALKIVVLNARVSIGFTLEEFFNSLFCNFAVRGVFFLKISIMTCLLQMEFSFGCLAGGGVSFGDLLSLSLILLYLLLLQSPLYEYSFWLFLILSNSYSVCFF